MKIFITNDDGVQAKGIRAIADLMTKYGHVTIVAPKEAQSGKSAAISLDKPLRLKKIEEKENLDIYYCEGTPVDCVKMAMDEVFKGDLPDLVISGINHGSNTSAASVYSGTLGAAMEGTLYGIPSIGLSLCSHNPDADFTGVIHYAEKIINAFMKKGLEEDVFLNVNFPKCPLEEIKGIKAAYQGRGQWINEFEKRIDPQHNPYYWMGGKFINAEKEDSIADHILIEHNYITIVPQKVDRTYYKAIQSVQDCIDTIE